MYSILSNAYDKTFIPKCLGLLKLYTIQCMIVVKVSYNSEILRSVWKEEDFPDI